RRPAMRSLSRRSVLTVLGWGAVALPFRSAVADAPAPIGLHGDALRSAGWFRPNGLLGRPAARGPLANRDGAKSPTTPASHPAHRNDPRRIPAGANPWNSDYLLPGQRFSVTLIGAGVYDFFCIPHEMAGMVGRIVVAEAGSSPPAVAYDDAAVINA